MSSSQHKNIRKTIFVTIGIMTTFLLLFLNKITTPRYLSAIELKVNRLELISPIKKVAAESAYWRFLIMNQEQKQAIEVVLPQLRKKIKAKTMRVSEKSIQDHTIAQYDSAEHIAIINPAGEMVAYFRPPFDDQKMILTYSSLFTHQQYQQ